MSKSAPHAPASETLPTLPRFERPLCTARPDLPWAENLNHVDYEREPAVRAAANICCACEHLTACHEWAMANDGRGVMGGLTDSQRARLRRGAR